MPLCPQCKRELFSRRHSVCGYCGATISPDDILSPEEAKKVTEAMERSKDKKVREQAAQKKTSGPRF